MATHRSPFVTGALLALGSAIAFGVTTPAIVSAGRAMGSFTTAGLLYAGASIVSFAMMPIVTPSGPRPRREHVPRLLGIALCGAVLAPVLFAWGAQRAGGTAASLVLNLEAVFSVALARVVYRELIGQRVAIAVALMLIGGALVALDTQTSGQTGLFGALAVLGATAFWALDNTLTKPLSDLDVGATVASKATLGALATFGIAVSIKEPVPALVPAVALLVCGATGYGLSLRMYLLAQRRIGAARTASVFATGPFVGAAISWGLGDRSASLTTAAGACAFGLGVYLHATEAHTHRHSHAATRHEHAHRHDDGHHDHEHSPAIVGEHTHEHEHVALMHDHDHAPDLHHTHDHEHV